MRHKRKTFSRRNADCRSGKANACLVLYLEATSRENQKLCRILALCVSSMHTDTDTDRVAQRSRITDRHRNERQNVGA
jgi:hypothetical protein